MPMAKMMWLSLNLPGKTPGVRNGLSLGPSCFSKSFNFQPPSGFADLHHSHAAQIDVITRPFRAKRFDSIPFLEKTNCLATLKSKKRVLRGTSTTHHIAGRPQGHAPFHLLPPPLRSVVSENSRHHPKHHLPVQKILLYTW